MIKASEAREIVKTSEASCARLLEWIDPYVRKLAEEGKTSFSIFNEELIVRCDGYSSTLSETPLMTKMVEKLKLLGYRTELTTEKNDNTFRGLGFYDDNEPAPIPTYKKFISISW